MNDTKVINEPEHEPTAETGSTEDAGETVEQLEDRLIAALERNEHLAEHLAETERRLLELETSRAISEPTHPADTKETVGTPSLRPPAKWSDIPPRNPVFWFRKWGE